MNCLQISICLQDQKTREGNKLTYIIFGVVSGWWVLWVMVSQPFYVSLFPFGFGKSDQLYFRKQGCVSEFFLRKLFFLRG